MITVSIQETRRGYIEIETQEETSTTIVHPDGSETGDYSDSPQNW